MKRKLYAFIITTITLLALAGYSSNEEDTKEDKTEQTSEVIVTEAETTTEAFTEITTEDAEQQAELERQQHLQDLYKFYGECLKNYYCDNMYVKPHFLICDLNNDKIPELYIGKGNHEYEDDFCVYKMYVDIDTEIELESDMEMYDGFFQYWVSDETSNDTGEAIAMNVRLNENNELEEVFKYSRVIIPINTYDYELEYYVFDVNGNKIKVTEAELQKQKKIFKSIYKAYDLSNANVMALENGKLEWNVQPAESEYFTCGKYKMHCGLYNGILAIFDADGNAVENYITFNKNGTFELTETKEASFGDKKATGKYEWKNGHFYLYYDSDEYFEELHISPLEDNYEMFMVFSCNNMEDQWRGYHYIGNEGEHAENKITERRTGDVIVTIEWTGWEQFGTVDALDMIINKKTSDGGLETVINDCFYSDDKETAGTYVENTMGAKGRRSVRLPNISGRYDIEIANPEDNNLADAGIVITIESDDGIVSYGVEEGSSNLYRGITGTWYIGIGVENGKVVDYQIPQ
ncbi:MAG: hypothetical protein NC240_09160 [Clostridium sp.]|nr:hypothetical protein [Clostridium sp.]